MVLHQIVCIFVVIVAASVAAPQGNYGYGDDNYEDRDYKFNYVVKDDYTYNYQTRDEQKNGNAVTGQYTLLEPTGELRVVNYVADEYGFRAHVSHDPYNGNR